MKNKKGFTLVELMLVVVIVGILLAIGMLVFENSSKRAADVACIANRRTLKSEIFYMRGAEDKSEQEITSYVISEESPKCPKKKKYTVTLSVDYKDSILCPLHNDHLTGGAVSGVMDNSIKILGELYKKYGNNPTSKNIEDFLIEKGYKRNEIYVMGGINETFRDYVYKQNGNKFDKVTISDDKGGSKDFYIQPMLNILNINDKNIKDEIFYYANGTPSGKDWKVAYIYNKDDGSWYKYNGKSNFTAANKTWSDIKSEMEKNPDNWQKSDDINYTPTPT